MVGQGTKHQLILDSLQKRIETGIFRPGDRLPTEAELVREFGVSRPTVSKAVGELERSGLVRRRRGSGTFVRGTSKAGSMFGLLIPGLGSTEIFEPICGEMSRLAHEDQHSLLWGGSSIERAPGTPDTEQSETALALCHRYIKQRVSGVFFAPLELTPDRDRVNREIVESLGAAGIPVVLLDRDYLPYPERSTLDLVGVDNRRVGLAVTQHLIERGCRRPVFAARVGSASTIDARIAGFHEALHLRGLAEDGDMVQRCDPRDPDDVRRVIRDGRPDGIVCGNDVTAAQLLHSLDEIGIDVPGELLVAGIDDVRYAELLRVPLTTVHQPCTAIGRAAFGAMLDRVDNPDLPARDILLACSLVVRASTTRSA